MVKIDIISGFLGAGKTTFANILLRYYLDMGLRPVYIVNEFGQTGLDAQIIESSGFKTVDIMGGCICCTLKGKVSAAIKEVIDAFSPTNIVFEPSGVFIFDSFAEILNESQLNNKCEITNVFTVVDSAAFPFAKAAYSDFICNQIKNSPVIILSKLEKTDKSVDEIICDIKNINPNSVIASKILSGWDNSDFENLLDKHKPPELKSRAHHHNKLKSLTASVGEQFSNEKINDLISLYKKGFFGDIVRIKGVIPSGETHSLINISFNDVSISDFTGNADHSLTFIGCSVNEKDIIDFIGVQ